MKFELLTVQKQILEKQTKTPECECVVVLPVSEFPADFLFDESRSAAPPWGPRGPPDAGAEKSHAAAQSPSADSTLPPWSQ